MTAVITTHRAHEAHIDPVYRDHISAIRCALNVSAKSMGHAVSKWQNDYQAGWRVSGSGQDMTRNERFTQDCMTRHLLHSSLSREQWAVLVIRFAPALSFRGKVVADRSEIEEMGAALDCVMALIDHAVSEEFSGWCLLRWARRMPPGRGAWAEWEGQTDQSIRTLHRRCAELYEHANILEGSAKAASADALRGAGLIG